MTNTYLRIQQSNKLLLNEVDNSGMGGIGLAGSRVRDHPFKTSACLRGGRVSKGHSLYIRIKNPLHKHFAGMPMVGG